MNTIASLNTYSQRLRQVTLCSLLAPSDVHALPEEMLLSHTCTPYPRPFCGLWRVCCSVHLSFTDPHSVAARQDRGGSGGAQLATDLGSASSEIQPAPVEDGDGSTPQLPVSWNPEGQPVESDSPSVGRNTSGSRWAAGLDEAEQPLVNGTAADSTSVSVVLLVSSPTFSVRFSHPCTVMSKSPADGPAVLTPSGSRSNGWHGLEKSTAPDIPRQGPVSFTTGRHHHWPDGSSGAGNQTRPQLPHADVIFPIGANCWHHWLGFSVFMHGHCAALHCSICYGLEPNACPIGQATVFCMRCCASRLVGSCPFGCCCYRHRSQCWRGCNLWF